ncbi:FG-GAP repeat domain-containing protein [Deinococcus yunweiensis]|uniref:FG-GAP repeat domain-containing protein n=1 Tax=Deinococcus yunweiensis TaxID=367282 RepID=UPI00398F7CCD
MPRFLPEPRRTALALLCTLTGVIAPAQSGPAVNAVLVRAPGTSAPYLLGAWQAGTWRPADAALAAQVGAGTYTRRTLIGTTTRVSVAVPESMGVPCEDTFQAALRPDREAQRFEVYTTAAATPPRPVTALPLTSAVYREVIRTHLLRRGVTASTVRLTALLRADLDGDGTQEVIVEASAFRERSGNFPPPTGQPGDYSVLLLRHVAAGKAVTTVLGEYIAPATPWNPDSTEPMPLATLYRVAGLADLNGDGRLELLTYGAYYEGDAFAAHEWTPGGGLTLRLETGCGV